MIEGFARLSRKEALAALKLLSVQMKENVDQIHNWQGDCIDTFRSVPPIEGQTKSVVSRRRHHFVVDLDGDKLATGFQRIAEGSTDSLAIPSKTKGQQIRVRPAHMEVLLPDRVLSYSPGSLTKGFVQLPGVSLAAAPKITVEVPAAGSHGLLDEVVDPRNYFRIVPTEQLWDEYARNIGMLEDTDVDDNKAMKFLQVSRREAEGHTVYRLVWHNLRDGSPTKEHVHDSDAGGNITRFAAWARNGTAKDPVMRYDYQYEQIQGVYLPVKFAGKTNSGNLRREITFENQTINGVVPDDQFGLAFFDAGDGAYVVDDLQQKVFRTRPSGLEFLGNYGATSIANSSPLSAGSSKTILIAVNVAVIATILFFLFRRQRLPVN